MSNEMKQINYPYIPAGRKFLFVPESNPFMAKAKEIRNTKSTDKNVSTGSVIVADGQIIGEAANQASLSNPKLQDLHKKICIRKILKIKTGRKYWLCPGCAKPMEHSEAGAIRDAKKRGNDTRGADLYMYGHWWSCKPCWDKMTAAGIRNVYLLQNSEDLFGDAR